MKYISKEKIFEAIKQIERFDKDYSYFYELRILAKCLVKRKNKVFLNKKSFLTYLSFYKKSKIFLSNKREDIYLLFLKLLKKIISKLEKSIKKLLFDYFIFKSKSRKILLFQIEKIKLLFKSLTKEIKKYSTFILSKSKKITNEIFLEVTNFFEFDNDLFKAYGFCISKIYIKIVNRIKRRTSLRFFFDSFLILSVNTNLFENVFRVNPKYLQNSLLEIIYERLFFNPLRLSVFN